MLELDGYVEGINPWDFFPWPHPNSKPVKVSDLIFHKLVFCVCKNCKF
jgi:hypothetical protein